MRAPEPHNHRDNLRVVTSTLRTRLLRAAAVLVFIAGLALIQGSLCPSSLTADARCATHQQVEGCASASTSVATQAPASPDAPAEQHPLGSETGVAGACLMLLLAVLLAVASLRGPPPVPARPSRPAPSRPLAASVTRALLPQLCVLRI